VIIFITLCTKDRQPHLATEIMHTLLREVWADAERWCVGRYVILPDHLHLFCAPAPENETPLASWIRYWKSAVSRQWHALVETSTPLWERHFWDRQLRSGESYNQKWDYVRQNPVRHGHCTHPDHWPHQGQIHELRW
jgi:putative transposase